VALKLLISFGAGLLAFVSPCVLPLLPGYVGYMTGRTAGEPIGWRRALPGTLSFVAGLSAVFISLGAGASLISSFLAGHKRALELVSGTFVIAMGAFMLASGRAPFTFLLRERRLHVRPGVGVPAAFGLGAAFAFGWTPCIGPTLGAALNLAATSSGLGRGVALLAAYSLGLGLPFLLAGLGLVSAGARLKRSAMTIQAVGGALLVGVGVLMVTGRLTMITIWMQSALQRLHLGFWNV
jgi:cytochrome c-type biogenesis protein